MRYSETPTRSFLDPDDVKQFTIRIMIFAKYLMVTAILLFAPTRQTFSQFSSSRQYISHYAPLAKKLSVQTGIPASVILGVALIESGHGSSKNCILLKNHFGIVGKNKLALYASPYKSIYKGYASDEASYQNFCNVIKSKKYYSQLKGNKNYKLWLQTINSNHYSLAGTIWTSTISKAINSHQLYRLDGVIGQGNYANR